MNKKPLGMSTFYYLGLIAQKLFGHGLMAIITLSLPVFVPENQLASYYAFISIIFIAGSVTSGGISNFYLLIFIRDKVDRIKHSRNMFFYYFLTLSISIGSFYLLAWRLHLSIFLFISFIFFTVSLASIQYYKTFLKARGKNHVSEVCESVMRPIFLMAVFAILLYNKEYSWQVLGIAFCLVTCTTAIAYYLTVKKLNLSSTDQDYIAHVEFKTELISFNLLELSKLLSQHGIVLLSFYFFSAEFVIALATIFRVFFLVEAPAILSNTIIARYFFEDCRSLAGEISSMLKIRLIVDILLLSVTIFLFFLYLKFFSSELNLEIVFSILTYLSIGFIFVAPVSFSYYIYMLTRKNFDAAIFSTIVSVTSIFLYVVCGFAFGANHAVIGLMLVNILGSGYAFYGCFRETGLRLTPVCKIIPD